MRKAVRKLRAGNPRRAVSALVHPHHTETRIVTAKARVAAHLREIHGNRVAHGPFRGMRLPEHASWGQSDVSAKILAVYERQITDRLVDLADPKGGLIDLGAADGYFAVGALFAGLFASCHAFEAREKARAGLAKTADLNGVADKLNIAGEATGPDVAAAAETLASGVVLCDIEGAEFTLLTASVLARLSHLSVIIELHDFLLEDGAAQRQALTTRAAEVFEISTIRAASPDIWAFPELDSFDDDHRMLAFSEGRDRATDWLVLRPLSHG
ncbi:MAG: hypothetical protein AAGB18_05400 [Pseudomonadota bacterium]